MPCSPHTNSIEERTTLKPLTLDKKIATEWNCNKQEEATRTDAIRHIQILGQSMPCHALHIEIRLKNMNAQTLISNQ